MLTLAIYFLVLINPPALFIYLQPIMKDLDKRVFLKVLLRAEVFSFFIYYFFALFGEVIFENLLLINFESFRIFGGIVISVLALLSIIGGRESLIPMKEDLSDLASEIALPFIVGAATITLSIIIGQQSNFVVSFFIIASVLAINFLVIVALMNFREKLKKKLRIAFDKNMGFFLRLNSFLVGAIGLNMVITGLNNLYF